MSTKPQASGKRIVVGVDGSEPSRAALAWAVRQAELTGATIDAIIAWHYPVMASGYGWAPVAPDQETDFEGIAAKVIAQEIAEVVDPASDVTVSTSVREGTASEVLLESADGASMLVVGSRGHGGFAGAVLGSVSLHCAHHSPCPLVIIRPPGRGARG